MKIPKDPVIRDGFFREIIDQCFASRNERIGTYDRLKSYFLFGTDSEDMPVVSKIYSGLDQLRAYLYSPETTKFVVHLGEGVDDTEIQKSIPLRNHLMDHWHDSDSDLHYGDALLWSLVYNSMFLMPLWKRGGIHTYVIEPHNVGVFREDIAGLDRQEAFCVRYETTTSQLLAELDGHPKLDDIMQRIVVSSLKQQSTEMPATLQRIITSAVNPNIIGQAVWWSNPQVIYNPKVQADLVTLYELWILDDELGDYRRVTRAENDVTIYDRQNTFIPTKMDPGSKGKRPMLKSNGDPDEPGTHPLVQICPNPQYNYFWGRSEISNLLNLQDAWAHRIRQIQRLGDKVVDPPKRGFGMTLDGDELMAALSDPHGFVPFMDQQGKVEDEKVSVPSEIWHEVEEYDRLFAEAMGISPLMKGLGESGVRSRGQTDTMIRAGSSRAKTRAMTIETSLDQLATKMLKIIQRYDDSKLAYKDAKGKQHAFLADQFTHNYTVKVDSHSMSPIFMEDEKQLMFSLFEARAINRERLLEGVSPVMLQTLLHDLPAIEQDEQAAQQAEMQAQAAGAQGKPQQQMDTGAMRELASAMKELAAAYLTPKRTELVKGQDGKPTGSITAPVPRGARG